MFDPSSNSPELQSINRILRYTLKPFLKYLPSQRVIQWFTLRQKPVTGPMFDGASTQWITLTHGHNTIRTVRCTREGVVGGDACLLYFHGGAYVVGSPAVSGPDAKRFALATDLDVYAPTYTLGIHAPYPAAVNDAEAAYEALIARGYAAKRIVLAGTSAGGGLAFALLHRLISKGRDLPACVVGLSPWVDLTLTQPSIDSLGDKDVVLSRAWLTRAAHLYGKGQSASLPELSPINGTFAGAPPCMVLYSEMELFRDENAAFVKKLEQCGVQVMCLNHKHTPHAWPVFAHLAPETQAAFDEMARFIKSHLA